MKYTVLIAEDNEPLRNILKDVLESWGYNVRTISEGRSCLEMARREQPDVILLDIMFPGLSGYEVCAELRQDAETRSIPVVMMTVLVDEESRIHGYRVDELRAIIQNLLTNKLYRDSLEEGNDVVRALQEFGRLLSDRTVETDALRMEYGNKLLESLGWDKSVAEKARTALLFPSPADLADRINVPADKIIAITDNLRMGRYLKPMLQFLNAPNKNKKQFRPILRERNCLEAAELVMVVDRYAELFNKEKDRENVLNILKGEADENGYNHTILKQLEEILKAEQILEDIQKNLQ